MRDPEVRAADLEAVIGLTAQMFSLAAGRSAMAGRRSRC